MEDALDRLFLDCSVRRLRQSRERIEACLERLTDSQVWLRSSDQENAVGNLVLHLCGNVRQWILSGVAGQPDTRNRDGEFAARGEISSDQLRARLRETLEEATRAIETIGPQRLAERVVIQGYDVSVLEAIYHVVDHFSGHTGQIIFAAKLFTGSDLGFYRHLSSAAHGKTTP